MDFRDTLLALLPPRRDDEPASLRQDIIDELGDHLACAYNRELLRGVNSSAARQLVLDRFGDPAAVACRLWLDAMKGKIMAQRVWIVTCLVVMLACLSLVGLVYLQFSRAAAQTAEANQKLAEALAQAQTTNKSMLSKMSEMSEAIRNPRSPDWNPLKFTLTEDTLDGPPAAWCSISIFSDDGSKTQIDRTSNEVGVADFGLVHPGQYSFRISRGRDRGTLWASGSLNVEPGSRVDQRIVCPNKAFEPVPLHVQCDWPADLEKEGLLLDVPFSLTPIEKEGTSWSLNFGMGGAGRSVLCGPGAALKEIVAPGLYLWAASSPPPLRADVMTSDVRTISEPATPLKWERGAYWLSELIVLRPYDSPAGKPGRQRFEILVRCYPAQGNFGAAGYELLEEPPTDDQMRIVRGAISPGTTASSTDLALPDKSWSRIATSFEARPERVNQWTITLPDELIKAVREKLEADKSPKLQ